VFVIYGECLWEFRTLSILKTVEKQRLNHVDAGYGEVKWLYLADAVFQ
jgi:hypothetical protein